MKKILIFVSIIMIILLMLSSKKDYYVIPDESIRFRIIANSNSTNDQYIKIKVKDVLEKEVTNDQLNTLFGILRKNEELDDFYIPHEEKINQDRHERYVDRFISREIEIKS